MASIDTVLAALRAERQRLADAIDDHIDGHPELKHDRALLESVPGIGPAVSLHLLTTLRSRAFASARQVAAFAGLGAHALAIGALDRQGIPSVQGRLAQTAARTL